MQPDAITLGDRTIAVVINNASGSSTEHSATEIEELMGEHGLAPVRIWCVSSEELANAFREVRESGADILIVLGGDGTIRSAAAQCTSTGPLLVPLPGGTMNVLPKALYGNHSWKEVLGAVLADPIVKTVSGGEVEGERFYISAICGAPALWANAREAVRAQNIGDALKHGKIALDHMFASKITYHFNEMNEGTAEALTVTCPLVSSALEEDRKVFEAAVIDVNHAGEVLELFTAAAFGQWRDSQNVATIRTPSVTVSSKQNIPIIVDGETIDAGKEVHIEFVPEAFQALVPAHEILP
jgi:diacylglycerol kinase family enzyme